ncbi:MAG: shikimate kinase [Bacteroidales bacterium]|nr:shikimate kinase [Bacteroidales bacterium]
MLKYRIVYIIGFMGSGKSTAGKKLAGKLGWAFIDLDKKIEEKSGKTISRIFSSDGEDFFRKIEAEVLKSMKNQTETVISTGGGTPCYGDNMDFMLKTGVTIYLKRTPAQLKKRLAESSGKRPLIQDIPDEQLLNFIEEKLVYREKWYNKAKISIESLKINYTLLHSLVKKNLDR